jgi:hypothetical protein
MKYLENIGPKWKGVCNDTAFEKRCRELEALEQAFALRRSHKYSASKSQSSIEQIQNLLIEEKVQTNKKRIVQQNK